MKRVSRFQTKSHGTLELRFFDTSTLSPFPVPGFSQVDCATSNVVDSLLDAAIELLEVHEGLERPLLQAWLAV